MLRISVGPPTDVGHQRLAANRHRSHTIEYTKPCSHYFRTFWFLRSQRLKWQRSAPLTQQIESLKASITPQVTHPPSPQPPHPPPSSAPDCAPDCAARQLNAVMDNLSTTRLTVPRLRAELAPMLSELSEKASTYEQVRLCVHTCVRAFVHAHACMSI